MKKIVIVCALILALSCLFLVACNKENNDPAGTDTAAGTAVDGTGDTAAAGTQDGTDAAQPTEPATDAPTEEVTETPTEGVTADPSVPTEAVTYNVDELFINTLDVWVADMMVIDQTPWEIAPTYNEDGDKIADSLGEGIAFTVPAGYWISEITASCPSWTDSYGSLTMYVYKWDTDFETTVNGYVLKQTTFENYPDNADNNINQDEELTPYLLGEGRYLILLKDPVLPVEDADGNEIEATPVGVWAGPMRDPDTLVGEFFLEDFDIESFHNSTEGMKPNPDDDGVCTNLISKYKIVLSCYVDDEGNVADASAQY